MTVVLSGDEIPMPGEQCVRAHDGFELLEHAAPQALRFGGQPNALVVGEPGTARTELLSKDAILGLEIVDYLALLLVDPSGQSDEEKPQRVENRNHRAQPIKDLDPISGQYAIAPDDALTSLERLDPRKGRLLELRFFGGLTVEEIAEVLGTSVGTVKREL